MFVLQLTSQAMRIVKFVTRKRRVLALFRTFSRLDLKKPAPTRFAFFFLVLERLCVLRDHLRRMVSSEAFDEFRNCTTEAVFFQAIVFAEDFWTRASEIVEVLRPVFYVLRLVDREGCTLGLIYEFMDRIGEALHRCGLEEDRYVSYHFLISVSLCSCFRRCLTICNVTCAGRTSSSHVGRRGGTTSTDPSMRWPTCCTHCGALPDVLATRSSTEDGWSTPSVYGPAQVL